MWPLLLVIVGLVLWAVGYFVIGLVLVVIGLVLLAVTYTHAHRGRGGGL